MSERLYKVVEAVDLLDGDGPAPERYLVFEDQNGNPTKEFFPENHTSLIHKGILYDWYGKQVKIASDIKRIIEPFGHGLGNSACEIYLIEKKDGKLALANLSTIKTCFYDPSFSMPTHVKNEITGSLFLSGQELKCPSWSFEKFLEQPIENTCFKAFKHPSGYKILLGVSSYSSWDFSKIHQLIYFYPRLIRDCGLIDHHIFKDRTGIMQSSSEELSTTAFHANPNAYECTNYLYKQLSFSDDGNKVTAYLPRSHGFDRISTDTEVLLHAKNNQNITWYYDPEP